MNVNELKKLLSENSIPIDAYTILGSNTNISPLGALSLEYCKSQNAWQLYIIERGSKHIYKEYESEEDACNEMFSVLMRDCTYCKTRDGRPI